jgi:hypothetical protein
MAMPLLLKLIDEPASNKHARLPFRALMLQTYGAVCKCERIARNMCQPDLCAYKGECCVGLEGYSDCSFDGAGSSMYVSFRQNVGRRAQDVVNPSSYGQADDVLPVVSHVNCKDRTLLTTRP